MIKRDLMGSKTNFLFEEQEKYTFSVLPSNNSFETETFKYFTDITEFGSYKGLFNQFRNKFNSEEDFSNTIKHLHSICCENTNKSSTVHILFLYPDLKHMVYFIIPPIVVYLTDEPSNSYYFLHENEYREYFYKIVNENTFHGLKEVLSISEQVWLEQQYALLYSKRSWCDSIDDFNQGNISTCSKDEGYEASCSFSSVSSDQKNRKTVLDTSKIKKTIMVDEESDNENESDTDERKIDSGPPVNPINISTDDKNDKKKPYPKPMPSTSKYLLPDIKKDKETVSNIPDVPRILPLTLNVDFDIDMYEKRKNSKSNKY